MSTDCSEDAVVGKCHHANSPSSDLRPPLRRILFTAEEAAGALAISTSLVRQLTLTGELPCRRIGRLVRYAEADLQAFVEDLDTRGYMSAR